MEYRRKQGVDLGIPWDFQLLLHQVKQRAGAPGKYAATLLRNLAAPNKEPARALSANGVTVKVLGYSGNSATVQIQSGFASRCKAVSAALRRRARCWCACCRGG